MDMAMSVRSPWSPGLCARSPHSRATSPAGAATLDRVGPVLEERYARGEINRDE